MEIQGTDSRIRISMHTISTAVRFRISALGLCGALAAAALAPARAQEPLPAPTDPVSQLAAQLDRGDTTLEFREGAGYLPSLLEHLDLNIDSQTLVFSKTSFQQALINPKNPRALYFNDDASVGTVPGGDMYEVLGLEPGHGMVFYTLGTKKVDRPTLIRRGAECFFCHGMGNKGAPSMVVATVYPNELGEPAYTSTFIDTIDHRAPFSQRWGGWYVTGTHGSQTHLGNAVAADPFNPLTLVGADSQNLLSLAGRFDVSKYLTGTSDIVALMTLEHQVGVANRLNATALQYRRLSRDGLSAAESAQLDVDIDDLVGYMLFVDEALLTEPVAGVSTFTRTFAARGPRDPQGRSLRDFDLTRRIFKYPLSYMIYSQLFDGMPGQMRERIYQRLYDVLTGTETGAKYATLSAVDRRAVLEILLATKPDLPPYWAPAAPLASD
jgi:hypothetical protein